MIMYVRRHKITEPNVTFIGTLLMGNLLKHRPRYDKLIACQRFNGPIKQRRY